MDLASSLFSIVVVLTMTIATAIGVEVAAASVIHRAQLTNERCAIDRTNANSSPARPAVQQDVVPATFVQPEQHDSFSDPGYWGTR